MAEWDKYWRTNWKRRLIEIARRVYFAKIFVGIIEKYSKKDGLILEAGCGSAMYLALLNKRGYNTVGADYSKTALYLAKNNCERIVLADIHYLPFKDNAFNMVFNQGVMEHFPEEEWSSILKEFKRVGENVVVIVPSKTSIFRIVNPYGDFKGDFCSRKKLRKIFTQEFKEVETHYMPETFFISAYCYGKR